MFKDDRFKEIIIRNSEGLGNPMVIDENAIIDEEFSKIVSAWTSYKLISEK